VRWEYIWFWLLSGHYRKTVRFSKERLQYARHTLQRLDDCVAALIHLKDGQPYKELDQLLYDLKSGFVSAMDDDLNISAALAAVFKTVKQLNRLASTQQIAAGQVGSIIEGLKNIDSVLGIFHFAVDAEIQEIKALMARRDAARREKNWELADQLREQLISMGVAVRDRKTTF
jgi:cysteinyl-tRNA synthetase